jgi:hypothetical protein
MLTQIQTTEWQVALLAACPRPRVVASVPAASVNTKSVLVDPVLTDSVLTDSVLGNPESADSAATGVPVPSAPSAWSQFAPISAAAFAQVPGFGAMAGYAVFVPRPKAGVRTDATDRRGGEGFAGLNREHGTTSSKQQDRKNLTARREPVTWRPPH